MRNGFTLIELSIVLAIASILAILSVSSFYHYRQFLQTCYITQSLNQSIYYARLYATIKNTRVSILPTYTWQNGWVIKADDKTLKIYSTMPLPIKCDRKEITIQKDGTAEGSNDTFEYGNTKLIINRGGRTRQLS